MRYILSLFFILLIFLDGFSQNDIRDKNIKKLEKVYKYLDSYYYDKVDYEILTTEAIISMLKKLDPHSVYLSKEEIKSSEESLKGEFSGVGIQYFLHKDSIFIVSVTKGGPSDIAGIKGGDRIIRVNDESVFGKHINHSVISQKLRGNKGSSVIITIYRKSENKTITFNISRDNIKISSLDACYMASSGIAYVRINNFAKNTIREIEEGLKELKNTDNYSSLILDLRGNTGGYLSTAVELASQFLDNNQLIVYTEGLNAKRYEYKAKKSGFFKQGKLVIMIDEITASASEIVAGAVQDWDRGIILGRRSYGKGLVQRPFYLDDGSVVRLTTARYYTPSGRCIQKSFNNGTEEYFKEIHRRYERNELVSKDSINFPDSLLHKTLIKQRNVFGSGGIMPDIFIPYDTNHNNTTYRKIWEHNLFNKYVIELIDSNNDYYNLSYTVADSLFNKDFFLPKFKEYIVRESNFVIDDKLWDTAQHYIYRAIKSVLFKNLFGNQGYYRVYNEFQTEYQRAINLIQEDKFIELGIEID